MNNLEQPLSILAIDDDPVDLKLLKIHISNIDGWDDFKFHGFSSWEAASSQLGALHVDLIFVDYLLGDQLGAHTGIGVVKTVRDTGDLRPIIVLTGQGDATIAAKITRAGADDYLTKADLDSDSLRRAISNALTQYKLRREKESLSSQLVQAQKMEAVGRLTGGIAHDFNNMLSIILGNTKMIMEDLDSDSPLISNLEEIYKAAQRSADLTRQLLAFARKQTISPKVLHLNQTLKAMLKMLKRLIGEDINLAWLPKDQLWSVKIDPSQVDQIVINLCVNARDAIKGVGKLTIETNNVAFDDEYCNNHAGYHSGQFVMITVSDTGLGMDKETMSNLFEPFFTTKDIGQGIGLGLSTVYGIVKQNKGFIDVYSEANEGTTFKIYLPRHRESVNDDQKKASFEITQTGSETILCRSRHP